MGRSRLRPGKSRGSITDGPVSLAIQRTGLIQAFAAHNLLCGPPRKAGFASAAEAFVSIVKHLTDSVVVVGQRTAGAENPVEM